MPNYISKYLFQFIFQLAMHENSDFFFTVFVNTCCHLFLIIAILLGVK